MFLDSGLDSLLIDIARSLQLTATQHREADARYQSVGEWLGAEGTLLAKHNPKIYPQGSLALGTTVRPSTHDEFDLDAVCLLEELDWRSINPTSTVGGGQRAIFERACGVTLRNLVGCIRNSAK